MWDVFRRLLAFPVSKTGAGGRRREKSRNPLSECDCLAVIIVIAYHTYPIDFDRAGVLYHCFDHIHWVTIII